jgi:transcriptional regulator with XRE-family HTH domain
MSTRRVELEAFQAELANANLQDSAVFRSILTKTLAALEMTEAALADAIMVSRPTVNRWIRGESAPHMLARQTLVRYLAGQVRGRLRALPKPEVERERQASFGRGGRMAAKGR